MPWTASKSKHEHRLIQIDVYWENKSVMQGLGVFIPHLSALMYRDVFVMNMETSNLCLISSQRRRNGHLKWGRGANKGEYGIQV